MDQKSHHKRQKRKWEKPVLVHLDVAADTKTNFAGALSDFTNTTTATNSASS